MDSTVNRATRRSFQTMILTVIKDARRSGNRRIEAKKETLVSHEDHLQGLEDAGKKKRSHSSNDPSRGIAIGIKMGSIKH